MLVLFWDFWSSDKQLKLDFKKELCQRIEYIEREVLTELKKMSHGRGGEEGLH